MDKTIYVVTSGEYSDYSIDGVFESKELAEQAMSKLKYSGQIEEYYLNALHKENPVYWRVEFDTYSDYWDTWKSASVPEGRELNTVHISKYTYGGKKNTEYSIFVRADNREAALKIANEKISQAIARNI